MAFEMPRADKPENVGMSSQRLQRIRDALQADIGKGVVPGAVALIARRLCSSAGESERNPPIRLKLRKISPLTGSSTCDQRS